MSQQSLFDRPTPARRAPAAAFAAGQRVRVHVLDADLWIPGGSVRFDGVTGTVDRIRRSDVVSEIIPAVRYLVRLGEPVPTNELHNIPTEAHWFNAEDLVAM